MLIRNDAPDTKENNAWRRLEMIAAVLILSGGIFYILIDALSLSEELRPKVVGLKPTIWSDSSRADLDDGQWSSFRSNLLTLILAAFAQIVICNYARSFGPQYRLKASLVFGLGFAGYLHGAGCLFLVSMVLVNYAVAKSLRGSKGLPLVAWLGNLSFLVMTEYYGGYKFQDLGLPHWLDAFPKVMSWHRVSNLCMLKIISFMMDWHWSQGSAVSKTVIPR